MVGPKPIGIKVSRKQILPDDWRKNIRNLKSIKLDTLLGDKCQIQIEFWGNWFFEDHLRRGVQMSECIRLKSL